MSGRSSRTLACRGHGGRWEDGMMPGKPQSSLGHKLIPENENPVKMDPSERLAWRQLVETIVDCYAIGIGRWQHFKSSDWHATTDRVRIFESAWQNILDWVNSERFTFYLYHFGYQSIARARIMLCDLLNGERREEVEALLEESDKAARPTGNAGCEALIAYNKRISNG